MFPLHHTRQNLKQSVKQCQEKTPQTQQAFNQALILPESTLEEVSNSN